MKRKRPFINNTTRKPYAETRSYINPWPTSRTGRLVHLNADSSNSGPLCGRRGDIVWTSLRPNCRKCFLIRAGVL